MASDDPHVRLRIPAELKAKIVASAVRDGRSLNSEIVRRLSESFAEDPPPPDALQSYVVFTSRSESAEVRMARLMLLAVREERPEKAIVLLESLDRMVNERK
jgi:Arc-like DNA binding domain